MTRCIHCTRCVRFAREIAGVQDLGMFGRGLNSEIGTYVQKTFQSELSGNVIELCPVGALTSKLYPFVSRNWELKNVSSIDFSDGFGSNLNIYLKNNKIIKISPSFDPSLNSVVWISDKTRFSFDGMFSPERVLEGFILNGNNEYNQSVLWGTLLTEIVNTLYFQDHLNKHFFNINYLTIVFGLNSSLEVLNLLILFSKKYSFIKLRKINGHIKSVDFEHNLLLNSSNNLQDSNLCFLIGVNTRYEGSYLNIKLRQRHLKGNFKIVSLGSFIDLTIPVSYSGLNIKTIKSLSEGNHFLCQDIVNSKNPIFIFSSELHKRKDFLGLSNMFNFLSSEFNSNLFNEFNTLNSSLNEAGVNYLQNFKSLSIKDLNKSNGIYFINANINSSDTLNNLIDLKVLNYFVLKNKRPFFCFDQNSSLSTNIPKYLLSNQSCYNYINLPNNVFFESNGTFMNTEGHFKKVVKFLPSSKQSKEDWQILRKIFSYSKKN
jgi:NADH dehydrogenase/NADH:ubiquinone oxidoreductase subunit G